MKIVVTGPNGMLGQDLVPELFKRGHDVIPVTSNDMDVTQYPEVKTCLGLIKPDMVIHTAAYTDVDDCEEDPSTACNVNITGTVNIADYCGENKVKLIFISTDHVFSGRGSASRVAYRETHKAEPINVYGITKLMGEKAIEQHLEEYYILRTSWLFGKGRRNYIDYYRESDERILLPLSKSNPTSTLSLSRMISKIVTIQPEFGIYHAACTGSVFKSRVLQKLNPNRPYTESDSIGVPRPYNTSLDNSKLARAIGQLPTWEESLEEYLNGT